MTPQPLVAVRCLLTQVAATVVAALLALVLTTDLRDQLARAGSAVAPMLVVLCEGVLLGCLLWAWLATTAVVLEVARGVPSGSPAARRAGVPRVWRRLVLAACGAALSVGVLAPAQAAPPPGGAAAPVVRSSDVLGGLPMPDRATDREPVRTVPAPAPTPVPAPAPVPVPTAERAAVVRVGDTLWSLARADLSRADPAGGPASDTAIGAHWRAIHRLNLAVLGPDPDLIVPGQRLVLPPPP